MNGKKLPLIKDGKYTVNSKTLITNPTQMNKRLFLLIVVIACVVIAYVANIYPLQVLSIGTCSLPFLWLWILMTDSRRKQ